MLLPEATANDPRTRFDRTCTSDPLLCHQIDVNMPKITIRNVPEGVHERLKQRAAQHHRSLNSELLTILEEAAGSSLDRKRQIHEEISENPTQGNLPSDPQTVKQKYREGLA